MATAEPIPSKPQRPPFVYTFEDDDGVERELKLKPLGRMPYGILRHARGDSEAQLHAPFDWAVSGDLDAEEVLDMLPNEDLPKVLEAWQKHSEVSLGESSSSSTSSSTEGSAKRSRRTLSASA